MPILVKSVTKLDADQKINRARQTLSSQSFTNEENTTEGFRYLNSLSNSFNYDFGFGNEKQILIESELESQFSYSKSHTYRLEEIVIESDTWENNNSFPVYYQVNYRQKFKMYFVNVYQYNYNVTSDNKFGCTTYQFVSHNRMLSKLYADNLYEIENKTIISNMNNKNNINLISIKDSIKTSNKLLKRNLFFLYL